MWLPAVSLPRHLAWIFVTAFIAMAGPLYHFGFGSAPPLATSALDRPTILGVFVWVLGVAAAIAATVNYRQRLMALIFLGAGGLAVSLTFVTFSAPDLALTQLLIDVATIALMMIVLHFLPQSSTVEPGAGRKWRDAVIAGAAGFGMAFVAHAVLTRPFAPISPFYLTKALPEGGGTNVVNVLLVDFRAFDTLGEITVLGVAALLIFALLAGFHVHRDHRDFWIAGDWNPLIVRTATRVVLPLAALMAVFLFLRGHNLPGGGFIAGLVLACAILALRIGGGGGQSSIPRICRINRGSRGLLVARWPSRQHAVRLSVPDQHFPASGAAARGRGADSELHLARCRRFRDRRRGDDAEHDVAGVAAGGRRRRCRRMMEWLFASGIGVFTACGVWLVLRARTFDVVLGLTLFSYAVNLFILAMGRLTFGAPAIIVEGVPTTLAHYADPLPQALALTAIVIAFAMTALVLTLALKGRFVNRSDACDADSETGVEEAPR